MAAKRSGYFQLKQPYASKKPKLDIEITPSQAYSAQPNTSKTSGAVSNGVAKSTTSSAAAVENLWDDDDDDIIVLASQAIEADLTFGKFTCSSVSTSTQQTTSVVGSTGRQHIVGGPNGKVPGKLPDKLLAELFADGEDDLFSEKLDDNYRNIDNAISAYFNNNDDFNLDVFRNEQQTPSLPSVPGKRELTPKPPAVKETSQWEEEFKVPEAPPPTQPPQAPVAAKVNEPRKPYVKDEQPSTSRLGIFQPKTSTATSLKAPSSAPKPEPPDEAEAKPLPSSQKQEHAKEIQVKFLTKHVEQLTKKLDSLQKDYNEAIDKAQVKDGEVSMLRYELKTVKSTNELLRLEKLREKETIQKEWIEKMKQLEKLIAAQKAENEFKEMEIMNLKTKRLNASVRSVEQPAADLPPAVQAKRRVTEESFILMKLLPKLYLRQPVELVEASRLDPAAFVNPTDGGAALAGKTVRQYSKMTRNELTIADRLVTLQGCLSTMLSTFVDEGEESCKLVLPPSLLPLVAVAAEQGLDEIEQYCVRLRRRRETEFRLSAPQSRLEHGTPVNLFQQEPLFVGEEAIVVRRFLALVGLYCRISNELALERLLAKGLVLRLSKNVKRISAAINMLSLHGMVTGAASLLNGLSSRPHRLSGYDADSSQLMELFRSIVLCQTDAPSTLVQLSDFLHRLSHTTGSAVRQLLNRLCTGHQPISTVKQHQAQLRRHHRLKSISFSVGSCTLQMYAALLENSVRQNVRYEGWQLKPLLANAENTIHFLRNVLDEPVGWVKSFYDKKDPTGCQLCHIRTVSAFVTLLHRVLSCWDEQTVQEEADVIKVKRIAQHGALLLHDLFEAAYRKKLLQLAGHTVRYRLRLTYNWLKLYETEFSFRDIHRNTLNMMDMRLLMNDPLRDFQETESVEQDDGKQAAGRKEARVAESDALVGEQFAGFCKTLLSNNALLE